MNKVPVPGKKYFIIGSLEKGIRILELLAESEALGVSEVAALLDINRSASHRFLATLRELGYVEKGDDGKYRLTFRILEQGMKVADRFEIRRIARPFMQRLSGLTRETINLGFWDGGHVVMLDKIDGRNILRMDTRIGAREPAYCTALGKAILAFLPADERDAYVDRVVFEPFSINTITTPTRLRRELEAVRDAGFATDDEEMAAGLRCVAAPVFDYTGRPRYALSVSGPAMRMAPDYIRSIQGEVRRACAELSAALGKPEKSPPETSGGEKPNPLKH